MRRMKIWFLIGGIALGYYGYKQLRLSGEVKAKPQTLTCKELGTHGYGDNAHVTLTEFMLSPGTLVYEENRKEWTKVWIPVLRNDGMYAKLVRSLPEDAEIPDPTDFRVILQSEHVNDDSQLGPLGQLTSITGVVINEIDSLSSDTKKLLASSYPGVDLDACWILDHDREPPGTGKSVLFLGLGAGLIAFGAYLFLKGKK